MHRLGQVLALLVALVLLLPGLSFLGAGAAGVLAAIQPPKATAAGEIIGLLVLSFVGLASGAGMLVVVYMLVRDVFKPGGRNRGAPPHSGTSGEAPGRKE